MFSPIILSMEEMSQNEQLALVELADEKPPKRTGVLVGKVGELYADGENLYDEPPRVTVAFKEYVQMGKGRSLAKLAEQLSQPTNTDWTNNYESVLRLLKDYSSKFNWQERLRQLITKVSTEALAEAQREALKHTKERIRLAIIAQKAGMAIIEAAKLDQLSVEEARTLLKPGTALLQLGLASERAEAGDNLAAIRPEKNPRDMSDEELEEYAEVLYKNLS